MTTLTRNEVIYHWVVVLFLGAFIILLPGFTKLGKNAFYLLSIVSLIHVVKNFRTLPTLTKHEKIFFYLVGAGFIWTLITLYVNGTPEKGENLVWSRQFFLVMIIPLFYLFLSVRVPFKVLFTVMVIASIATCAVAVYDVYFSNSSYMGRRAHGGMHPILFASIALCLAGFVLAMIIYGKKNLVTQLAGWGAVLLFCVAVILSNSRGPWLAIPLLFILGFGFGLPRVATKTKLVLLVVSLMIASMVYFVPVVQKRIDVTATNLAKYMQSESVDDNIRRSSLGTRLEMWKAGLKMFWDSPFLGVGTGGYQQMARQNLEKYNVNQSAASFYHPHNQFVSALATRGLPGLLFLLALFLYPLFLVWRTREENKENTCYVFAGMFIGLAYIIFSLTDVPLEGKPTILFYTVAIAYILANARRPGIQQ